jgi:hypothetical protein
MRKISFTIVVIFLIWLAYEKSDLTDMRPHDARPQKLDAQSLQQPNTEEAKTQNISKYEGVLRGDDDTLFVRGELTTELGEQVQLAIQEGVRKIVLDIPDGEIGQAFKISELLQQYRYPIEVVHCIGVCLAISLPKDREVEIPTTLKMTEVEIEMLRDYLIKRGVKVKKTESSLKSGTSSFKVSTALERYVEDFESMVFSVLELRFYQDFLKAGFSNKEANVSLMKMSRRVSECEAKVLKAIPETYLDELFFHELGGTQFTDIDGKLPSAKKIENFGALVDLKKVISTANDCRAKIGDGLSAQESRVYGLKGGFAKAHTSNQTVLEKFEFDGTTHDSTPPAFEYNEVSSRYLEQAADEFQERLYSIVKLKLSRSGMSDIETHDALTRIRSSAMTCMRESFESLPRAVKRQILQNFALGMDVKEANFQGMRRFDFENDKDLKESAVLGAKALNNCMDSVFNTLTAKQRRAF